MDSLGVSPVDIFRVSRRRYKVCFKLDLLLYFIILLRVLLSVVNLFCRGPLVYRGHLRCRSGIRLVYGPGQGLLD